MNKFIARYEINGVTKSVAFDKARFSQEQAEQYLNHQGIKNFFFFFEPYAPEKFGDNAYLFRGDIGFDITTEKLLPYLQAGNEIILDSFGGDLWEGLKMYDAIKALDIKPSIGVLGSCASAATLPLLATPNRWMTPNSRFLIHNPWAWEAGDDEQMRKASLLLESEKNNLGRLYALETGNEFQAMIDLMKEEKFINANEALQMNFITSTNNKFNLNDDDMNDNEVIEKVSGLETAINGIKSMLAKILPGSPKNIVVQDTNGNELEFLDAETEEQIAVNQNVNVNGEPNQTGEYTKQDGTVYVITDGVLTGIREPAEEGNEEMEALKAENERLTAELADVQNSLKSVETERDNLKNSLQDVNSQFETVRNEFVEFKNKFSVDTPKPNGPEDKGENKKKFSYKTKK